MHANQPSGCGELRLARSFFSFRLLVTVGVLPMLQVVRAPSFAVHKKTMHDASSAMQGGGWDRCKSVGAIGDGLQPIHQPLKDSFLLVMIALVDAHSAGMLPDLGLQKQKTQLRRGQLRMFQFCCVGRLFPIEQGQPAVQVVGQHGQLKVNAVHGPALGGMRRQPASLLASLIRFPPVSH